jgi:signal peptidase II
MAEAALAQAGADRRPGPNRKLGLLIAAAALAVDQVVKWLMLKPLHLFERSLGGDGIVILPFFRFLYTENPGLSMRFLPAGSPSTRWVLVALTATIAAFVLAWIWREKRRDDAIALALILGGALGNIADRVRLGFVIDYADLHFGDFRPFLVFNFGDVAITIGVLLLLVPALLGTRRGTTVEAVNG